MRGATGGVGDNAGDGQLFQSTLPVRGATGSVPVVGHPVQRISIHAPREGGAGNTKSIGVEICVFQSTLPVRGATTRPTRRSTTHFIFQSTLPVRGATTSGLWQWEEVTYFNPRSP